MLRATILASFASDRDPLPHFFQHLHLMNQAIPLQFLVGLMRLISIYFCIQLFDQVFSSVMTYQMMKHMAFPPELEVPSIMVFIVPALSIYLVIALVIWFAAPFVCRVMIPSTRADDSDSVSCTYWSEVMIFLVGTLFAGVGLTRLSQVAISAYNTSENSVDSLFHRLEFADKVGTLTAVVLIGSGVILMTRFPSIHRWIQSKSMRNPAS